MTVFGRSRPDKVNKKTFALPHLYVILFCTMLFVTALTYVVPSGEFERVKDPVSGRMLVVPGSYSRVESSPVGLFEFGLILPKGIAETVSIVAMVLFCCGSISVISGTGAIDAGIASIIRRSKSKEHYVLLILFTLFSFLGAAGYAEDVLPFVPLTASIVLALGYDKLVAAAVVFCGVASGFTPGFCNLMTVGVSHAILGLPIFSGMSYRLFAMACFYSTGLLFVLKYAHMIKKDPTSSMLKNDSEDMVHKEREFPAMTPARGIILFLTLLAYATNIYGAFNWGWYLDEMSAVFIFLAVAGGVIGGLTPNMIAKKMSLGIAEIAPTAIAIGIARSASIILREGNILDTVINFFAGLLTGHGPMFVVVGLILVTTVLNFLVTSGSGMASAMMPLLGPLGQVIGVNQQVVVFSFQMGDGITNTVYPTSGFLMGGLSMIGVPYDIWVRFAWKLYAFWLVLGCVLAAGAQMIQLGPF